jgi:tRNA A-37 threonylcarbamoyl transferase component Bud32
MNPGEPPCGATPVDAIKNKPNIYGTSPLSENPLPIKTVSVGEGSTAKISRQYYADGSTEIVKMAVNWTKNQYLRNEYKILKKLENKKLARAIPHVNYEIPNRTENDTYGFSMEDLQGFRALSDTKTVITNLLDTDDKMSVIADVGDTLTYANSKKYIHNDLQLQHIMLSRYFITKLIDWGSAQEINDENKMNDVKLMALLIPQLFNDIMLVPKSLQRWLVAVNKKQFLNPESAWKVFTTNWGNAFDFEINSVEPRRLTAYGPSQREILFP